VGGEGEVGLFGRHLVDWQVVLTFGGRELWMAGWTLVFERNVVVFLVATCMNVPSARSGYVSDDVYARAFGLLLCNQYWNADGGEP
jgi:hypothetical protein